MKPDASSDTTFEGNRPCQCQCTGAKGKRAIRASLALAGLLACWGGFLGGCSTVSRENREDVYVPLSLTPTCPRELSVTEVASLLNVSTPITIADFAIGSGSNVL